MTHGSNVPAPNSSRQTPHLTRPTALLRLSIAIAALFLGTCILRGQSCTPTPSPPPEQCPPSINECMGFGSRDDVDPLDPTPDPPLEFVPDAFQPPDGSKLSWQIYIPTGTGPFPTVIIFHGGLFSSGSLKEGGVQRVCGDLQRAGFLAVAVNYRLAPCGRIAGQDPNYQDPLSGRPPQQTDDAKSLIRAARSLTTLCNGNVGVLGGSSGGSLAVFTALDKTPSPPSTYPHWCQDGHDDRPLCAVGLSAGCDLSDRVPPGYEGLESFIYTVQNYTNSCVLSEQKSVSPVAVLKSESEQTFKPLYLVNSEMDSMPWHQIEDMRCALVDKSINAALYTIRTIAGKSDHSFDLWLDQVNLPLRTKVRDEVLAFLEDHVKNPP